MSVVIVLGIAAGAINALVGGWMNRAESRKGRGRVTRFRRFAIVPKCN
jgi:hypothetical protein